MSKPKRYKRQSLSSLKSLPVVYQHDFCEPFGLSYFQDPGFLRKTHMPRMSQQKCTACPGIAAPCRTVTSLISLRREQYLYSFALDSYPSKFGLTWSKRTGCDGEKVNAETANRFCPHRTTGNRTLIPFHD